MRAIKSIQILAEQWALKENVTVRNQHENPFNSKAGSEYLNDSTPNTFDSGPSPQNLELVDNTSWLLEFDGTIEVDPMELIPFNEDFWPSEFV